MTAVLALALTLPLAVLAARVGRRWGWLDEPEARKSHRVAVPRTGGWALALGGGLVAAGAGGWNLPYLVPALLYFAIGVLDDAGRLGKGSKLGLQVLATIATVGGGLRLAGEASPLLAGLWLLAVLELLNFLDGIDLITCAVASVLLAGAAASGVGPGDGALYAAMCGATIGVAFLNATPARLFLGDGGTHLLGFLVAGTAMAPAPAGHVAWPVPLAAAALLPVAIDIGWGMLSKRRLGFGWTDAHRVHLYQRLTRAGWSHAAVALRYGVLTATALLLASRERFVWFLPLLAVHLLDGLRVARRVAAEERSAEARDPARTGRRPWRP